MSLASSYNPKQYETEIYKQWLNKKVGSPEVQEEMQGQSGRINPTPTPNTYSIVVPPPNLTGDLHMGHAFEHFLMDTLTRIARQQGKPTLYFPGVDHAGIQLEGVINKLINRGEFDEQLRQESYLVNNAGESIFKFFELEASDRANFLKQNFPETWLKFAWEKVKVWRGNQLKQAEKLGDTPDFDRLLFTLDPRAVDMVNYAFIRYWQDGLIHKGSYLINWSVALQTALSDVPEDISHEERKDPFITFEYQVSSFSSQGLSAEVTDKLRSKIEGKRIQVGTVRPETVFGDVAVAVHPSKFSSIFNLDQDEADLVVYGLNNNDIKIEVELPAVGVQNLTLIADESVDANFGTGALKITPGSDITDYNIASKHGINQLPQAIGRDGKLTAICGEFAGLTVEHGRMAVIKRLIEDGFVPTKNGFEENRESVQNKPSVEKLSDPAFRESSLEKQKEYLQKNYPQFQVDWNYVHNVVLCERSKTVVEPIISEEFFVDYYAKFKFNPKMVKPVVEKLANQKFQGEEGDLQSSDATEKINLTPTVGEETTLQQLALAGVAQTNFFPVDYKERAVKYFETIKNWCISRDLIWGHKMPVWYNLDTNPERRFYSFKEIEAQSGQGVYATTPIALQSPLDRGTPQVGESRFSPTEISNQFMVQVEKPTSPGNWVQENKILDTWFSSTLWPLTTLNFLDFAEGKAGIDFEKFYPTQTMTTAKEIFYAWIVRMIMTGMYFAGQTPFENYLAHAWVLDDKGKKMSKSLGNVVDVAEQIEKFSSDAVRLGMLEKSIPGRNIRFGGKLGDAASEKYRNFGNKLWNIARFLEGKEEGNSVV